MKGPGLEFIEDVKSYERSPTQMGLLGAAKGAVLGAPAGALIGHLSGGSALAGTFIGGLLAAAAFGAGHAVAQDLENKERESELRVHLENLKEREPFFYMPPKPLFTRMLRSVR